MKLSQLYKLSGAGLLAISLAVIPFSALAQTQTGTDSATDSTKVVTTEDNNIDWGWLGLLGLLGLAGLAGKNNHRNTTNREVESTEPFPETPSSRRN